MDSFVKIASLSAMIALSPCGTGQGAYAGEPAELLIDLDPRNPGIDSAGSAVTDSTITLAILIRYAGYLDTYSFGLVYDKGILDFVDALPGDPSMGAPNILETRGGTALGFIGRISARDSNRVTVANSLAGGDSSKSPNGEGVLALVRFRTLAPGEARLRIDEAVILDWMQVEGAIGPAHSARISIGNPTVSIRAAAPRPLPRQGLVMTTWDGRRADLLGRRMVAP